MDFILSLAHFCEVHGPTSVLCTQVQERPCDTCHPTDISSPPPTSFCRPYPSPSRSTAQWFPNSPRPTSSTTPRPKSSGTPPTSPDGEDNPYFPSIRSSRDASNKPSGSFETEIDACASCTFETPEEIASQLPKGAPGSPTKDGKGRHGSPVIRSKEPYLAHGSPSPPSSDDECSNSPPDSTSTDSTAYLSSPQPIKPSQLGPAHSLTNSHSSSASLSSRFDTAHTHTHTLTYMTARNPPELAHFSLLRRSIIHTLSVENLPRGSPSGPMMYGNSTDGYTIAYIFRLPDPCARGYRRTYALIALGGRDSWRVTAAFGLVERHFEEIARRTVLAAERTLRLATELSPQIKLPTEHKDAPADRENSKASTNKGAKDALGASVAGEKISLRNITPVSSFLSARKVDPDGVPRAATTKDATRARGLVEITADDRFFVKLHSDFAGLLKLLLLSSSQHKHHSPYNTCNSYGPGCRGRA